MADTFSRILIFYKGMRPAQQPRGQIDVVLTAKGGTSRLLRLAGAGEILAAEEVLGLI